MDVDRERLGELEPNEGEEEEEGEELIGENMLQDYRAIPALDVYDAGQLAPEDEVVSELSPTARARAERSMRKRDMAEGRRKGRLPRALGAGESDEESDGAERPSRRPRLTDEPGEEPMDMDLNQPVIENLEDRKGHTLREWVCMESPSREIYRRFRLFLTTFVDAKGNNVHADKIRVMCEANKESLVISYTELCREQPSLAVFVADAPLEVLKVFDEAAKDVVRESFPAYERICPDIHVRISDLPVSDNIRDIRQIHLNALIKVSGVVTRRTGVFPMLSLAKYTCAKCQFVIGPIVQDSGEEHGVLGSCPDCQSRGPFVLNSEETVFRNYQRITIQESPGTVPAGRLPRQKEVVLLFDLVDSVKPGDEIEVTSVYRNNFDHALNTKHGFPVFATVLEANFIERRADKFSRHGISDDDRAAMRELSQQPGIGARIVRSIAPSIYGHEDVKIAMALAMFGGESKNPGDKHRVRGDINVLVLGDPGTAKSQFLKYVEKTAPRAVFTTGQGASAVGLTASVSRDPVTREWTLQGGALVLADQGVCLIDEFDKMNDQDRTSIHEAMEQQSISISKAGIVTSLQARCSVIAAANPIRGKYQPGLTFSQNVDLTEPILSRFDVLCVVKDVVDPVSDERLASFVVRSHIRSHPSQRNRPVEEETSPSADILPQDLLRKYIIFARQECRPKLNEIDQDKIAHLYSELRREAMATGSIPITVRHVESIIRLSEAHARMHLRNSVQQEDVDMAIRVTLTSFVESQKHSVMKAMQRVFAKYITHGRDVHELLLFLLSQLLREAMQFIRARYGEEMPDSVEIDLDEFKQRAKQLNITEFSAFFDSPEFARQKYDVDEKRKIIIKTF